MRFAVAALLLAVGCAPAPPPPEVAPRRLWPDHPGGVRDVGFSADGGLLATAGADGIVRLWDPAAAAPAGTVEAPAARGMRGVVASYRQRALDAGRIDADDFDPLEGLPYERGLSCVALSADGSLLAILVEDAQQAQVELRELPGGEVRWIRWLHGWPEDRPPVLIDVDDGDEEVLGEPPQTTRITFLDFDTARHAADNDVRLSFVEGGARLRVGSGEAAEREPVRLREGRWWLAGDPPRDLGPGRELARRGAARSPDGRWLVVGDRFGALRLWDLGTQHE